MEKKYYEVLTATQLKDLEQKVMVYCESGWYPQGGFVVASKEGFGADTYYQAMTKNVFAFSRKEDESKP